MALWCNKLGKYFIEEIEKDGDKRRFQIKEVPAQEGFPETIEWPTVPEWLEAKEE